jgi:3-dehydroquinate synthase
MWAELLTFNVEAPDFGQLQRMVAESVAVKQRIVTEDPTEQGIRKALNLGHTVGHAFESFALRTMGTRTMGTVPSVSSAADYRGTVPSVRPPQLHGYFVAFGLICELYLSAVKCGFPTDKMHQTVSFIKEHYGKMAITCDDYPHLLELMHHDKKNEGSAINFTLLANIGDLRINQTATEEEIKEALDFYREY